MKRLVRLLALLGALGISAAHAGALPFEPPAAVAGSGEDMPDLG